MLAIVGPLNTAAQSDAPSTVAPHQPGSPLVATLLLERLTIELVSDWALLKVEGSITAAPSEIAPSDELAVHETPLWPMGGTFMGLQARHGTQWFTGTQALSAVAHERFLLGQWGPKNSQGHLFELYETQGLANLAVRPLAPAERLAIAYRVLLPTRYADGVHRLQLPAFPQRQVPQLVTRFPRGGALVEEARSNETRNPQQIAAGSDTEIVWRSAAKGVVTELVSLPQENGAKRHAWRIRATSELIAIPRRAHLVVLLDTSRSWSSQQLKDAKEGAQAWIAGHPDAQVAVVSFDHKVHLWTQGFISQTQAQKVLESLPEQRQNGSFQDLALAEAESLLDGVVGPKRVLLLTDGHLRPSLTEQRLQASFRRKQGLLLVGLARRSNDPRADQQQALERLATGTSGTHSCAAKSCTEGELLHPQRVENLRFARPVLDEVSMSRYQLEDVPRGSAASHELIQEAESTQERSSSLGYNLWGQRFWVNAEPDPLLSRYEAARLSHEGCVPESAWTPFRGAINANWSFSLSIPGRVTAQPDQGAFIRNFSCGATCSDCGGTYPGTSVMLRSAAPLDRSLGQRLLGDAWKAVVAKCGARTASIRVYFDGDELEDLDALKADGASLRTKQCLLDDAWEMSVPVGLEPPVFGPYDLWSGDAKM